MNELHTFLARRVAETRRRPDAAAVLVEFAMALPLLTFFLLGIFEFGFGFRQKIYQERASQSAGRAAASTATDRYADFDALRAIDSSMGGSSNLELTRVIIWDAPSADATVPPQCLNISASGMGAKGRSGLCNVYSPEQVAASAPTGFRTATACAGGAWDANWCPLDRDNAAPDVDFVGVYIEAEYDTLTNLLPVGDLTFTTQAVYHLEPSYVGR